MGTCIACHTPKHLKTFKRQEITRTYEQNLGTSLEINSKQNIRHALILRR